MNYEKENDFYKESLFHSTVGQQGRNYLGERGINLETIKFWEIGWSPISNNKYTKLKGRITFPVRDQHGKIITISGRKAINTLSGPKYDMYPFSARKILFGLWQNKENIRKENRAAITEGQIDVITSWQHGYKIATSSFGAHGSLDQLAILSRYAKKIDVLYDSDAAGFKGIESIKSLSTLGDLDVNFKNPFPKGEDLDSWIKKNDVEKLLFLLDKEKIDELKIKLFKMKRGLN